jgi:hypothetical protein
MKKGGDGSTYNQSSMQATANSFKNPVTANEDASRGFYGPNGTIKTANKQQSKAKVFGLDRNSQVVHQVGLRDNLTIHGNNNINRNSSRKQMNKN